MQASKKKEKEAASPNETAGYVLQNAVDFCFCGAPVQIASVSVIYAFTALPKHRPSSVRRSADTSFPSLPK